MVLAPSWNRPSMLNSFGQFRGGSNVLPESSEPVLSSAQNNPHARVVHLRMACPEPHQFSPLKLPRKFHILKAELVDCSISVNTFLSPDNRSLQLNSFQKAVMKVAPKVRYILCKQAIRYLIRGISMKIKEKQGYWFEQIINQFLSPGDR